jgi:hypothetical protein
LFSILKILGVKVRKQVILDGPVSCGKSIALAMLVQWAREEGWLVFYVPRGKEWTHGGFFYKHPQTALWDTPVQAENVLKVRLRVLLFLALPVLYHCMFCVFLCFKEDK